MEVARRLRAEARRENERRVLVLAGDPDRTRERAAEALDSAGLDRSQTTYVGHGQLSGCETLDPTATDTLLGTTRTAIVLDCHDRCEPNALGSVVGAVDGGGLLLLLTPALDTWDGRRDEFDATLAVPPYESEDVTGAFRQRLVETLRAHRGVAIVDVDAETLEADGSIARAPRLAGRGNREAAGQGSGAHFPSVAYDACKTGDQREALSAFERLREDGNALVVEADRGRGKSSVAGLAAASLALEGRDVLVTASQFRSVRALFARARELIAAVEPSDLGVEEPESQADKTPPAHLETRSGSIRFCEPASATELPGDPDRVFVDEAAALPVHVLDALLDAPGLAFVTTIHGYEGTGRGFTVRFREHLANSHFDVSTVSLSEPIRYAAGDPVEVWSFRALALAARPPVDQLVADATTDSVTYRRLRTPELLADETLLQEVFGLLVLAHYRTEPNDLARVLDAPNVSVHALFEDGHPVSVALLAREGGLPAEIRSHVYEGGAVRGNLVPDLLASQLRDEAAAGAVGYRVLRIVTHSAARSRGLGSRLLSTVLEELRAGADWADPGTGPDGASDPPDSVVPPGAGDEKDPAAGASASVDWFGVAFGATPRLLEFWRANGFRAIHLGISRDDRSGEHSAIMLDPLSSRGAAIHERHAAWFLRRLPATLTDALADVDPDVVRAVCRATAGTPSLDLETFEWRVAAGMASGGAFLETAPRPARRLALRHLVAPAADCLTDREERLLVARALQCRPWEAVADDLDYHAPSNCKRALGEAVGELVAHYGTEAARRDLDRGR